jgi:hypothetical protein
MPAQKLRRWSLTVSALMVKALVPAPMVAALELYKVAYTGAAPRTHHRNLHRQSQLRAL